MKLSNISITISETDLLDILKRALISKNVLIEDIEINKSIIIKNIRYRIFKNINLDFKILKVLENKIYVEINKLSFKCMSIPKTFLDIFTKFIPIEFVKENKKNRCIFIFDLNEHIKNFNTQFFIRKICTNSGFINIVVDEIFIKNNTNKLKQKGRGGLFLRLTQTILKLSGDDIMSFIRDFIRTDSVMISGIDVSQAVYLKGIIVNSFEIGDVSINIKDLKENLLYVQLKIINSIFPGVNIEHIPIKIFVKDILKSLNNLNLDLDINSVRFIDDCIEVKINNLNLDMKKLPSNSNNIFLK